MSDLKIETWFPTVIGVSDCPFIGDIKKSYNKILKTLKFTKNGLSYHQLHEDKRFNKLTKWVSDRVNDYAKIHNFEDDYQIGESWINDYRDNHPQPFHVHNGWTISANFIFNSDINDMRTVFKSPRYVDMKNPIKSSPNRFSKLPLNEYTFKVVEYEPVEGRLLIFRSNTEHSTSNRLKKMKTKRIIFAFNLDPKKEI